MKIQGCCRRCNDLISGTIGCVLSDGLSSGAYQVGVLKALNEHGIGIDAVSGSGIGALNAMFLNMGGIEGLEHAWTDKAIYRKIYLLKLTHLSDRLNRLLQFSVLPAILVLIYSALSNSVAVKISTVAFLSLALTYLVLGRHARIFLSKTLFSFLRHSNVPSAMPKQGKKMEAYIVVREKIRLFDPEDPEYLVATPLREATSSLFGSEHLLFRGKVRPTWLPKYQKLREQDQHEQLHERTLQSLVKSMITSGFVDEAPVKPVIDLGCRTVFVIRLSHGQDDNRRRWIDEHLARIERKLLLKEENPALLVARYNVLLASLEATTLCGKSPAYFHIGRKLLQASGITTTKRPKNSDILLVGRRHFHAGAWPLRLTTEPPIDLVKAGYHDMLKALLLSDHDLPENTRRETQERQ